MGSPRLLVRFLTLFIAVVGFGMSGGFAHASTLDAQYERASGVGSVGSFGLTRFATSTSGYPSTLYFSLSDDATPRTIEVIVVCSGTPWTGANPCENGHNVTYQATTTTDGTGIQKVYSFNLRPLNGLSTSTSGVV